ncbi:MAG: AAA family ATPase [Saprospiraceae bacterium]
MANYWLFQANPQVFRLRDALQAEALQTFAVTAHKQEIKVDDKVILWQSGKEAGCYGLATVVSEVGEMDVSAAEKAFFKTEVEDNARVKLKVDYNLWNKPITRDLLMGNPVFAALYAGLPGTNFAATEAQYQALVALAQQMDVLAEPAVTYQPATPNLPDFPLNLILHGPPGTGKTFQTVNYAVAIIENRSLEELALENRGELHRRFDEYVNKGQISFVTFHQSFGYEDFVEGIKPVTVPEGSVSYAVELGIFRLLAQSAHLCVVETLMNERPQEQKQLQFNQIYGAFIEYLQSDNFKYFETADQQRLFLHQVKQNGDLAVRQPISFTTTTVEKALLRKLYQKFPLAENIEEAHEYLGKNMKENEQEMNFIVFATLKGFEQVYREEAAQAEIAKSGSLPELDDMPELTDDLLAKCKRYVLIVDEINRGNVSAIFGELLTLLEPDKREGRSEALKVALPYSKTYFSVPPNLYLLGTMNTADRSTDVLDIALRRRFAFEAIEPDPNIITKYANKPIVQGIDLAKLLQIVNDRIELLLDRDHRIGHAYFLNIETLEDLKQVFSQQIIPLLQEYFFNDYAKIGLVLGGYFVREKPVDVAFAPFGHPYAGELSEKRLYELCPIEALTEEAFIHIYKT